MVAKSARFVTPVAGFESQRQSCQMRVVESSLYSSNVE